MKKYWYVIASALILATALFLRLFALPARAPFDWDQNRDYSVISEIANGKPILIGPVAKGEGGFFLGPLYYYLVTPTYLLTNGDPLALPLTSVLCDVLAILAMLVLFPRVFSKQMSLTISTLWTFSFFAIEMSKISWNVALLPLFSVLLLYFSALSHSSKLSNLLFGLLLGMSWHIHASLIPFAPLYTIFLLYTRRLRLIDLPLLASGYLAALSPLILFDLRHNFLNLHLLISFTKASGASHIEIPTLLTSVFSRFGKNIYSSLFVQSDLHLGWGIGFTVLALLSLLRGSLMGKLSGAVILLNLALVILLREAGFAEYYLGVSYLPTLILLFDFLAHFRLSEKIILVLSLVLSLYASSRFFTTQMTSYSLGQKQAIVRAIATKGNSASISYGLPFGRDSGFNHLLPRGGVNVDSNSRLQVVISEKMNERLFINGEITEDLGYFGGMHAGYRVLQ